MFKICTVCNIEREIMEFYKKSSSKDGYRTNCKYCCMEYNKQRKDRQREYNKNYIQKNSELLKEKNRQYYRDNIDYFKEKNIEIRQRLCPEKKKEYSKKYESKESTKEKRRKKISERLKSDPLFKLRTYIRKRILYSLMNGGYSKKSQTENILGCSIDEFKIYIESKFKEGMSWENQGEWHLDHIKPSCLAQTEAEILELNHYSNFQPLWASENLSKGGRWND